tara:strand:+ start:3513 stop:4367 length:855 start_codon:yes stop_codon:yes gene_type:complete
MPKIWRVIDVIKWAESYYKEKEFENPRSEIEWLLCSLLNCKRIDLYLRFEEPIVESELKILHSWINRRMKREPLQYITESCDFFGREFLVNESVLIPRPETERLIDIIKEKITRYSAPSILDIGTGSGCIAITLGLEIPESNILGIDISVKALSVAKKNKDKLVANNVSFKNLDFIKKSIKDNFHILVSNPPYIPEIEMSDIMEDVKNFEPIESLTDKEDGLLFYRRFSELGRSLIKPGGSMILEVGAGMHPEKAKNIFLLSGYNNVELIKDYNDDNRVLVIDL